MKIALSYDLRQDYLDAGYSAEETAEFDRPETIDAIEQALQELGHDCEKIGNDRALARALLAGHSWDLVFNICEGLYGPGREALVPALLDSFSIPYTFSDPLVMALTLDKGICKTLVKSLGLATADFAVIRNDSDLDRLGLPFPLFVKPLAEGTSKGIDAGSKVFNRFQLEKQCRMLLAKFRQPVLVESYLPGREFTVGLLGSAEEARILGVMEVLLGENAEDSAYSYLNKAEYESRVSYRLVDDAQARAGAELALAAWRGLNCRDAGRIDIRLDSTGRPSFMEVNPLAGLNPQHSDLAIICRLSGIPYRQLISEIIASAQKRIPYEIGKSGHSTRSTGKRIPA